MKIESITLHHISMPLVAPFETSFGRETDRECVLITLQAEGTTGYGECVATRDPGYSYETAGTAWHIIKDFIAPLILGQDILDAGNFQKRVDRIRGHHLAKAGVEMALWDLLGKRTGNVKGGVTVIKGGRRPGESDRRMYLEKGYARQDQINQPQSKRLQSPPYPDFRLGGCTRVHTETADACRSMISIYCSSNSLCSKMIFGTIANYRRNLRPPSVWMKALFRRAMRVTPWRWKPAAISTSSPRAWPG
jgi:hypothetical protein